MPNTPIDLTDKKYSGITFNSAENRLEGFGGWFGHYKDYALAKAQELQKDIVFKFNGIDCIVGPNSKVEYLFRDYCDAMYLDMHSVGPIYAERYSEEYHSKLDKKKAESKRIQDERSRIYKEKQDKKKRQLMSEIKDESFEVLPGKEKDFKNCYEINKDSDYGRRTVEYAIEVGKLCQSRIKSQVVWNWSRDFRDVLSLCDYDGITGFMEGAAKSILRQMWIYGNDIPKN